jgi:16S rRNA (guanine527-N7)-methyltransferase
VPDDLAPLVSSRLARWGIAAAPDVIAGVSAYLELLARWNQRINLTGFDLARPSDQAIDRLIAEPLAASRLIRAGDRLAVDVGSGSGSPALPMKIAAPWLDMVLIESRERKSAFLREAVRTLGLRSVTVETTRLGREGLNAWNGRADIVTLRAVRMDEDMRAAIVQLLGSSGRVFQFGEAARRTEWPGTWAEVATPLFGEVVLRVRSKPSHSNN